MKIQLETITNKIDRSFSILFNPRLSDLFFWHFHPEYELVYIEGANGPRRVGAHVSTYKENDLVLIGSNIPHLNFDYGVTSDYRKVVVHLKKEFIENHFSGVPELASIRQLFEKSSYGLAFHGAIKEQVGKALFELEHRTPFEQHLSLLTILYTLSNSNALELLHEQPYNKKYSTKEQHRLNSLYAFIDQNYHRKIPLQEVADISNMTKEAFCRYFKRATEYSFIEFLNRYRVSQSKRYLMVGTSVSEACYRSGFESLSYYNRVFKRITNENPSDFSKKYLPKNGKIQKRLPQ